MGKKSARSRTVWQIARRSEFMMRLVNPIVLLALVAAGCGGRTEDEPDGPRVWSSSGVPICTCDPTDPKQDCDGPDGDNDEDDNCRPCKDGEACIPANVCDVGQLRCAGGPTCDDSGKPDPQTNGAPCGSNLICRDGRCTPACTAGQICTPANGCHLGVTACAGGKQNCTDTGQSAPDGTSCGANQICQSGQCQACPASSNCSLVSVAAYPAGFQPMAIAVGDFK
jgi:hypothetical protein